VGCLRRRLDALALVGATLLLPLLVACAPAGATAGPRTAAGGAAEDAPPTVARPARPQNPGPRGAEAALRRTFEALAAGRRPAYLATLDPDVRDERLAATALTFATQGLLGAGGAGLPRLTLRDLRYAATVDDTGDLGDGVTWARVRVTGVVGNPVLGVEQAIDAVEVARRAEGVWFTTVLGAYRASEAGQAFSESAEGERLAAAREEAAARGRRFVSVQGAGGPRSEGRRTSWPVTLSNPDALPHTVTLQLRGLKDADGHDLLDAPDRLAPVVERGLEQRFHLAPLSRVDVRPAIESALLADLLRRHPSNTPEGIEPVIYTVDGAPPETPEEVAARIRLSAEAQEGGPRLAEYGGVRYLDSLACRIRLHNDDRIGHRLEELELSYTTVERRPDGGLSVHHRARALADLLIPAGGTAVPTTTTGGGALGSRLAPAEDLIQAEVSWLSFTLVDRGERIEQRRYVPGCEVSLGVGAP
jgi:hypothetical protein